MKNYGFPIIWKYGVEARCKKCRPIFKMNGDILVVYEHPEIGVDGKPAYRLFWRCRCAGHIRSIGYTRPVDFSQSVFT